MKIRLSILATLIISLTVNLLAGPRDTQWKKVSESVDKGLPKSAIEQLEPIITGAIADQAYAEAIKDALDRGNNSTGFVQSQPCPLPIGY